MRSQRGGVPWRGRGGAVPLSGRGAELPWSGGVLLKRGDDAVVLRATVAVTAHRSVEVEREVRRLAWLRVRAFSVPHYAAAGALPWRRRPSL
uniref:Uncharacterized protein n=1 Tax=Arundo donax TaxID=35708 RepID=A0A0A9BYI2_ARUDO